MTEKAEPTSADVLAKIWQDFAIRAERESGLPITKRATSLHYLDGDDRLLTRWLKPGTHKNWRIPLYRIPDVCRELRAPPGQEDKLMMARFAELAEDDPKHEALVAALWAFSYGERQQWGLSADEVRLMSVFRVAAKERPVGMSWSPKESEVLGKVFEAVLKRAEEEAVSENRAIQEEPQLTPEESAKFEEKKRRWLAKAAANQKAQATQKREAARASARGVLLQVRDYLRILRQRRP